MDRFETFMSKHGEHGIQAILEDWERHVGVSQEHLMTLEQRWDRFLTQTNDNLARIAA